MDKMPVSVHTAYLLFLLQADCLVISDHRYFLCLPICLFFACLKLWSRKIDVTVLMFQEYWE